MILGYGRSYPTLACQQPARLKRPRGHALPVAALTHHPARTLPTPWPPPGPQPPWGTKLGPWRLPLESCADSGTSADERLSRLVPRQSTK